MTLQFKYNDASLVKLSQQLEKIPLRLRERLLKKALKEAGEIFMTKAVRNIRSRKAEGRDRWGKVSPNPLEDSVRRRVRSKGTRVGAVVDIHSKRDLRAVRTYAASMEFGHDMWVYGERKEGAKVPEYPFWRPAQSASERPIEALVLRELKRLTKELFKA